LVFTIGTTITLVNNIENGVYAMIALSLMVLLFRAFQANGSFLGSIKIKTLPSPTEKGESFAADEKNSKMRRFENIMDTERKVFLPLDRKDGSNPRIQLEAPEPGIFLYRLTEGFHYGNCYKQLDDMADFIIRNTRRGQPPSFEKPGVSAHQRWNPANWQRTDPGTSPTKNRKMAHATCGHDSKPSFSISPP
jgi:solute carrier family 26 (sodium-independent sulfate anion transporter), member 11